MAKGNHSFTESDIRRRFGAIVGHTVAEVDTAGVLAASKASRNKGRIGAVIECPDGRFRRLVPDELDQLQGFPKGWTDTGMTDGHRAFCMGNALVTGVPHRIGEAMVEVYGL